MSSSRLDRSPLVRGAGELPIKTTGGSMGGVPPIDAALVEYLRRAFPFKLERDKSLRDYDRELGAREVIDHLAALYDEQNNNSKG